MIVEPSESGVQEASAWDPTACRFSRIADSRVSPAVNWTGKGGLVRGQEQAASWGPKQDLLDGGAKQSEMTLYQALVHLALSTGTGADKERRPLYWPPASVPISGIGHEGQMYSGTS